MDLWTCVLIAACALFSFILCYLSPARLRVPLAVFLSIYLLTTAIGGVIISATEGQVLIERSYSIDLSILDDVGSELYWSLLLMPLVIVPLTAYLFRNRFGRAAEHAARLDSAFAPCSPLMFMGVVLVFSAYCAADLVFKGYGGSLLAWSMGDYISMIQVRSDMATSLTSVFFGIVYSALPAFSQYALYQAVKTRSTSWRLALAFTIAATILLCMTLVQKSIVLVYLLFLGAGLVHLKVLRPRSLLAFLAVLLILLTGLQLLFLEEWDVFRSVNLVVFRLASSFPFYVNAYPRLLPHGGIDFGLHLIGVGDRIRDNVDIFDRMYPGVTWAEGAAAAAAHVKAYAQAGLWYSVVTLILVGMITAWIARLRPLLRGPIGHTLYLQALVFLYYCTQTSLRESIVSCYGFFWTTIALVSIILVSPKASVHEAVGRAQPGAAESAIEY